MGTSSHPWLLPTGDSALRILAELPNNIKTGLPRQSQPEDPEDARLFGEPRLFDMLGWPDVSV